MARQSQKAVSKENLLMVLEGEMNLAVAKAGGTPISILEWAKSVNLGSRKFSLESHEYQRAMLEEGATRQAYKKGAQMGCTEINVLRTMHGLISGRYPQGALYLFPSQTDVQDFSRGRFAPLLDDNESIASHVQQTDSIGIKRVGRSMLYLRGARSTSRIEGIKKTSSQLKSVPVDITVFDEMDEMDPAMIDLAVERLSHSDVKEESYLSTPSIPDYGIDKLYQQSDQRIWMIKCERCGAETCLEIEFPNCLLETSSGKVIRICKRCKSEIHPHNGRWVASYPDRSKDLVGWWISQLNSAFVDPGKILKLFNDPPNGNLAEIYNSKLGMAYVAADNRLTIGDVYRACGQDVMATKDPGPCFAGIDVGQTIHAVVGFRPKDKQLQIAFMGRVSSFNDVHDICKRFNVRATVCDREPEIRSAREFQESEKVFRNRVWLADYVASAQGFIFSDDGLVRANRTELLDASHDLITNPGRLIIPRRCEEIEVFAKQCSNVAKTLEENQETGARVYRYRTLGPDHYRHALSYALLASQKVGISSVSSLDQHEQKFAVTDFDPYDCGHDDRRE